MFVISTPQSSAIDINLLTAKAPRSFLARDPGAASAATTFERGASYILVGEKSASRMTGIAESQSWPNRILPIL